MRPDFLITGLSANANDRLLSITVTDEAGIKSDAVKISLDDRDYKLATPPTGQRIKVFLGYKETGLTDMGLFEIDEVSFQESPVKMMEMSARGQFHENSNIKQPRTQPWDEQTLGGIISAIAGRNGYTPDIDGTLAGIWYDHVDQTEESDIHFASRLAEQYDAYAKLADGKLLFKPRGKTNGSITVINTDSTHITGRLNRRNKYKSVKAWWHDPHKANRKSEVTSDEEPQFEIRHTFESKEKAALAAAAKFEQLQRGTGEITQLTIPGNPAAKAEMDLITQGFRPDLNKTWVITSVTHTWTDSGATSSIKAEESL